jgi:hypothetical protein
MDYWSKLDLFKIFIYFLQITVVIHLLLWLIDGFPFFATIVAFATNALYFSMLKTFPDIEIKSVEFLSSIGMDNISLLND